MHRSDSFLVVFSNLDSVMMPVVGIAYPAVGWLTNAKLVCSFLFLLPLLIGLPAKLFFPLSFYPPPILRSNPFLSGD